MVTNLAAVLLSYHSSCGGHRVTPCNSGSTNQTQKPETLQASLLQVTNSSDLYLLHTTSQRDSTFAGTNLSSAQLYHVHVTLTTTQIEYDMTCTDPDMACCNTECYQDQKL